MLKLSKEFYVTSIVKFYRYRRDNSKLNEEYIYSFKYKNFQIKLAVIFTIMGHTDEDNIAIVNFGYLVDIEKWSDREQEFCYIRDLDETDGRSTKKYLDSAEAREIILRFVEKSIDRYLRKVSPAIIIRGPLSDVKSNLPRYKRLDLLYANHGYHKKELDIKKYDSLYEISAKQGEDDKVIWAYSRKIELFDNLRKVLNNL